MSHPIDFHVVGVSHHTVELGLRERLALTPAELREHLAAAASAGAPLVVLSTCNRCEAYWTGDHDGEAWFRRFIANRGIAQTIPVRRLSGESAVRHLFSVTSGLDSQIVGESEILGQVRRAYEESRAACATSPLMDLVFGAATAAGRRVRRETVLGRHPVSVATAGVRVLSDRLGGVAGRRIVVIGAGEVAEGCLRALHRAGADDVAMVNRRVGRAQLVAEPHAVSEIVGWEALVATVIGADAVITAIGAPEPVLSGALLAELTASRNGRPLVIVDLALPRNVEPTARALAGLTLLDLDDLQHLCCPAPEAGPAALADIHRVLDEELARLDQALKARAAAPRLAELHRIGEIVVAEETERTLRELASLGEDECAAVRNLADRIARRLLYPLSRALREGA